MPAGTFNTPEYRAERDAARRRLEQALDNLIKATKSGTLYTQTFGRVPRLCSCVFLDFVDNAKRKRLEDL